MRLALLLASALLLGGCGDERDALTGDAQDEGALQADPCRSEAGVMRQVFTPSCAGSGCHSAVRPRGELDLSTPGIAERIAGHRSIHPRCGDEKLIVPGAPERSFLMKKLLGDNLGCGDPMPPGTTLAPEDLQCVARWIASLPRVE